MRVSATLLLVAMLFPLTGCCGHRFCLFKDRHDACVDREEWDDDDECPRCRQHRAAFDPCVSPCPCPDVSYGCMMGPPMIGDCGCAMPMPIDCGMPMPITTGYPEFGGMPAPSGCGCDNGGMTVPMTPGFEQSGMMQPQMMMPQQPVMMQPPLPTEPTPAPGVSTPDAQQYYSPRPISPPAAPPSTPPATTVPTRF